MIFEFLLSSVVFVLTGFFGLLPNLPAMPTAISDAGDFALTLMQSGIFFLQYIYGQSLLVAIMLCAIALFNFDNIYTFVMWALRKIPLGSR